MMEQIGGLPLIGWIGIALILLCQSTVLFIDARKRGHNNWLWGILGLIQFPIPILFYFLFVRPASKNNENKQTIIFSQRLKKLFITLVILSGVIPAGFIIYGSIPPTYTVNSQSIEISGMYGMIIERQQVIDIKLEYQLPQINKRSNGIGLPHYLKGNFVTEDLGKGKLFVYQNHSPFIYLLLGEEGFVIINKKDPIETEAIYHRIQEVWDLP